MAPSEVWYVAYGSNLHGPRLQRYLDVLPDRPTPLAVAAEVVDHRLFFAHESRVWTGGTAFLDPEPGSGETLARRWLLTVEMFAAVVCGENARTPGALALEPGVLDLGPGDRAVVDDGRYGLVVGCPGPDRRPTLTVTTPASPLPGPNPPSPAYVGTIVAGLVDAHGLSEEQARAYVAARVPGA